MCQRMNPNMCVGGGCVLGRNEIFANILLAKRACIRGF